jgi:hypothetical protein
MKRKSNRLVDRPETAAIKPLPSDKKLVIEDLNMTLDEYLNSLGLDDDPLPKNNHRLEIGADDSPTDLPEDL